MMRQNEKKSLTQEKETDGGQREGKGEIIQERQQIPRARWSERASNDGDEWRATVWGGC